MSILDSQQERCFTVIFWPIGVYIFPSQRQLHCSVVPILGSDQGRCLAKVFWPIGIDTFPDQQSLHYSTVPILGSQRERRLVTFVCLLGLILSRPTNRSTAPHAHSQQLARAVLGPIRLARLNLHLPAPTVASLLHHARSRQPESGVPPQYVPSLLGLTSAHPSRSFTAPSCPSVAAHQSGA